jgi:hypothetical protein
VSRPARIVGWVLAVVGAVLVALVVALVVAGMALEGRTRRGVAERLAESLQAEATIERGSLSLVFGTLDLEALAVRRDDAVGHLAIGVADIHCALPALGMALLDRDCRELAVREVRFEVSAAALFKRKHPRRPPLHARRVVVDDVRFEFSPSAFLPGLGRIAIAIAHAEAGETRFKTPLSWLLALRTLRATIELPAGIAVELRYDAGVLSAASPLLGAAPVVVPVALPAADPADLADPADDARAEVARLAAFGKDVAERLAMQRAQDWLNTRLSR